MKKEELVATRLPRSLVLDLKKIESTEQSDRSTVLRKLLHTAVADWKKALAAMLYAEGKVSFHAYGEVRLIAPQMFHMRP